MKANCDTGSQLTQALQDEAFVKDKDVDTNVKQDNDDYADYHGNYSKKGNYQMHDSI